MTPISIYAVPPNTGECLCHGEILSELSCFRLDVSTMADPEPAFKCVDYQFVILLSQACDLAQDFSARRDGGSQLPELLFCQAPTAADLKNSTPGMNSRIWDRVKKNKDERYHFLERIPAESDSGGREIPELCIDFKRYFTLPTDEVYRRIELGRTRRRTVLTTPFLEHLSSRFAYFLSRVALPRDHVSE